MQFLAQVDTWFLIMAVVLLGGFFVWAIKYIFDGLKASIAKLDESFTHSAEKMEKLITELFNHRNDHETRITKLETKHELIHGNGEGCAMPQRQSAGRRAYDPDQLPEG